jgi:predicted small secreted protein
MRLLIRVISLAAVLLAATSLCGCKNSMRIAHDMVEAESIGRDIKALNRSVDLDARGGE